MDDKEIEVWFKRWCKKTKRSGGVLIGKSIKELLHDFSMYNKTLPDAYYKQLFSFNKFSIKKTV